MAPNVAENLSRLTKSSLELNKLADEATSQIRALGKFLESVSPGVDVSDVQHFHEGREKSQSGRLLPAQYLLGYERDDEGKYGLVVSALVPETGPDGRPLKDDDGDVLGFETVWIRRLDQTPRPMRIAAIARLPKFIESLADAMDQAVEDAKRNIDGVREASDELIAALCEPSPIGATKPSSSRQSHYRNLADAAIAAGNVPYRQKK